MNSFDDYKAEALATAIYPNRGTNLVYPTLGLNGEAGEFTEHVKKMLRDDQGVMTMDRHGKMVAELGDVLWYVAAIADELGVSLSYVAQKNLEKLRRRRENGTVQGSGSER
jgi:NTP pyrophosphatase (non-canonical NTP hydrolase)